MLKWGCKKPKDVRGGRVLLHASGDGKGRYGWLQENVRCKTRLPLKKTDKSKQWDVLEKSILSVKAAEKCVGLFLWFGGVFMFSSVYICSLLSFRDIQWYSVQGGWLCSAVRVSGPQEVWSDTQRYRGTFRTCNQAPVPSQAITTALWAPELVPEQGAFLLVVKTTACQCPRTCRPWHDPNISDSSWSQAACLPCCRWGAMGCSHVKKQMDQYRSVGLSYYQKMGKWKSRPE